jgi:hypothetical protein
VLYEAAPDDESRPFPRRVVFTGWFDTGKQGEEWPGEFEIVKHQPPRTWKAAKSVVNKATGHSWIRVQLRGLRTLSHATKVRFRYTLSAAGPLTVVLLNSATAEEFRGTLRDTAVGEWTEVQLDFSPVRQGQVSPQTDEVHFLVSGTAELLLDDLLIYEPEPLPE